MIVHETHEWLAPQLMWESLDLSDADAVRGPVIAKFETDAFMERFLERAAAGSLEGTKVATDGERLFLPFHQRYHLVLASLVCNRLGFPDRALDVKAGESVGFVLRREGGAGEEAWIPGVGWSSVGDDLALHVGGAEEVLPLVAVRVGTRTVWHGFVPLASAESVTVENEAGEKVAATKFGPSAGTDTYVLRCVYRRPGCRHASVVISDPSPAFEVSTFLDPTAPQRPLEIGLDLGESLENLARPVKFKLKGAVAGAIGSVADAVNPMLPDGIPKIPSEDLDCDSPGFSIPWITLCAMILLIIITAILYPILITLQFLLPSGSCGGFSLPAPPEEDA